MSSLTSRYLRRTLRSTLISRNFTASAPVKDSVQNLYIKILKSYTPTGEKTGSEVGQVKELILPTAPQPPTVDTSVSSELLSSYEAEDLPPPEVVLATESLEKRFIDNSTAHAY
ncbi:19628_t:CDS:2 [Funneliformis geosporum]|uniref:13924_t:CDS:1 n=1 Tax=Funneliformis geosporum TaxID=1117311 RepID=A0A9W4SJ46_9GLOM|nr:13924_t:CDS:2 [Funneliformis geosporum]CAI2180529.1 19628_t:CDS:2 [Funneliformis geosporum]